MGLGLYTMPPRWPLLGTPSSARMGLVVDLGESLEIEMGVDLGRGNIGVAQQLLHCAQIARRFQQMGGKGMAQHVRMKFDVDTVGHTPVRETALHAARAEALAAVIEEQRGLLTP